jgi:toxin ParE1/3/4
MSAAWWRVELTPEAERDFAEIVRWTRKTFGAWQAQTYRATLREALKALHSGPNITGVKKRNDVAPGIRILHVARGGRKGRHFIVFRVGGDRLSTCYGSCTTVWTWRPIYLPDIL